mmetsp:Transcript_8047/g.12310  ORF Transcript_8047/g.12310 Transcript_8047/m.12310 type:complete len:221 (+) Transcript_8047:148-810(+)
MMLSIILLFGITNLKTEAAISGSVGLWEDATKEFFYILEGLDQASSTEGLDLSDECKESILDMSREEFINITSSIPHISENMLHEICSPADSPDFHQCDFLSNVLADMRFNSKVKCTKAGGKVTPMTVEGKCTEGIKDIVYQSLPACGPAECSLDDILVLYEAIFDDAFNEFIKKKVGADVECTVSVKDDDEDEPTSIAWRLTFGSAAGSMLITMTSLLF